MSNVRYGCPTYKETGCGAKLFAAPGGTSLKCRFHDEVLVQMEEWHGATFEYIEDESGRSRTGRATHLRTDPRPDAFKNIKEAPEVKVTEHIDEEIVRARLRDRYKGLYGKDPDKRWGLPTLRRKVADKEETLERESAERSAREKAAAEALEAAKENA